MIAREPGNTDAWKLKGDLLLYTKNKPDDALAAYRKALRGRRQVRARACRHPEPADAARQARRGGQAARTAEDASPRTARRPSYFEAQLAYQKKDFKLARELSQPLLQQAPNNPQMLQLAGAVELQLGAVAQAEIYLSKATQLAPQLRSARRLLIATYLRSGQSAKALAALNAAAGKDGIEPALYSLAGEVYLQNGDAKKAEEYFAKALKLDPDNASEAHRAGHHPSGKRADHRCPG